MSESLQLRDPLFKLIIRFSNGEQVEHVMTDSVDTRAIAPQTKYAIISLSSRQNPSICTEKTVINLRDVSYIKSERVTLSEIKRACHPKDEGRITAAMELLHAALWVRDRIDDRS